MTFMKYISVVLQMLSPMVVLTCVFGAISTPLRSQFHQIEHSRKLLFIAFVWQYSSICGTESWLDSSASAQFPHNRHLDAA